jgi:hypothetical protein
MTHREKLLFDYKVNSTEALKGLHDEGFNFIDYKFIWEILIYELEYFDIPTQIFHHHLSSQDITIIVKKHFGGNNLSLLTIALNEFIIPDGLSDALVKAKIKMNGEIWIIHNGDKDLLPSSPHAHNYQENYKLHLGNGGLYRKSVLIDKIKKKHLIALREKIIEQTNINLPPYQY